MKREKFMPGWEVADYGKPPDYFWSIIAVACINLFAVSYGIVYLISKIL